MQPIRSKYSSALTPEQVADIRAAPLPTRHADLARRYGVTPTTIARIRRGQTWSNDHEVLRVRVPKGACEALEVAARESGTSALAVAGQVIERWASRYGRK